MYCVISNGNVVGRIMAPTEIVPVLISRKMNITSRGSRNFADVFKLRILRERLSWIIWVGQKSSHESFSVKEGDWRVGVPVM